MSTTDTTTDTALTRRDGLLYWRRVRTGPRGGRETTYAPRRTGQVEPSAWVLWSSRLADVSDGDVLVAYSAVRS